VAGLCSRTIGFSSLIFLIVMLRTFTSSFIRTFATDVVKRSKIRVPANIRDYINFSRVPRLNPADITERVSRGSGPGGQAAATTNYAVTLIHVPTHVVTILFPQSRISLAFVKFSCDQ